MLVFERWISSNQIKFAVNEFEIGDSVVCLFDFNSNIGTLLSGPILSDFGRTKHWVVGFPAIAGDSHCTVTLSINEKDFRYKPKC